ncbi:MAG: DcrB-related protein [Desulfobacterales bacterium]|nr:DcrB-related protein [Desulfobacterales bacterium]
MTCRAVQWGRVSFQPPDGFSVQGPEPESGDGCKGATCVLLCQTPRDVPAHFPLADNPGDLDPAGYPVTISLTALPAQYAAAPRRHLEQMARAFTRHLADFKTHFNEPVQVGEHSGARGHFSFTTNFPIHQLVVVWQMRKTMITATMMAPDDQVGRKWKTLERFCDSVRLQP